MAVQLSDDFGLSIREGPKMKKAQRMGLHSIKTLYSIKIKRFPSWCIQEFPKERHGSTSFAMTVSETIPAPRVHCAGLPVRTDEFFDRGAGASAFTKAFIWSMVLNSWDISFTSM
jgi:hypothetical protein